LASSTPPPPSTRGRGHVQARTLGALTPRLTKIAFQKFGFATVQLVTDWPQIVGQRLARTTAPDRIRWPRRPDDPDLAAAVRGSSAATGGQRQGATVYIRVEPAVALDVQYQTRLILERINAYFGYRAVAEIRLVQGAVGDDRDVPPPPPRRPRTTAPPPPLTGIADDGLRAALERLRAGLYGASA
jgi:hypothetical protein